MSRQPASLTKAGFTLVEVIISLALGATIMVGLWTVFDIFSALQQRADTQSARAQLARGLLHQLQDDLDRVLAAKKSPAGSDRALVPAATQGATDLGLIGPNDTVTEKPSERIAFFGSPSWLVMDLARFSLNKDVEAVELDSPTTDSLESVLPVSRVVYHFVLPELAILDGSIDSGLTRWELSNPPIHIRDLTDELDRGEWGTLNSIAWRTQDDPTAIVDVAETDPQTSSPALVREQVPEIKRFLFRYFDGENWRATWDSRREGSLPLAVECLLIWRDRNDVDTAAMQVDAPETADIGAGLDEISLANVWENLGQQDYSATATQIPDGFGRYVLCLPASVPPQRHFADAPAFSLGERLK